MTTELRDPGNDALALRDTFRAASAPCHELHLGEVLALCRPSPRFLARPSATSVLLTLLPLTLLSR